MARGIKSLAVKGEEAAIDIEDMVVNIIMIAVGAVMLGALLPTLTNSLNSIPATVGGFIIGSLISLVPLLVVLAFIIGVVMWAVGYFKKQA